MGLTGLTLLVLTAAAPPPGNYSAGPNPIFGSPGAYGPGQYSYPAPGTYGSTTFNPFGIPPLSGSPAYNVPDPLADWPVVGAAKVTVRLPADAQLWVDGRPTKQTGSVREFITPAVLKAGLTYYYTFRAQWPEGDRTVTRERRVAVRTGGTTDVDLTKP